MFDFIEKLRAKPQSFRTMILILATIFLSAPIFLIWILSFRSEIAGTFEIRKNRPAQVSEHPENGLPSIKDGLKAIISDFGGALKNIFSPPTQNEQIPTPTSSPESLSVPQNFGPIPPAELPKSPQRSK